MALDFNNKIPEWKNEGIEPTDELKEKGFTGGYKPPATVFNWFWNKVQKCITELQTKLKSHVDSTSNPHKVTKSQIGLGNVNNTSDLNKPISNAVKNELDIINKSLGKVTTPSYTDNTGKKYADIDGMHIRTDNSIIVKGGINFVETDPCQSGSNLTEDDISADTTIARVLANGRAEFPDLHADKLTGGTIYVVDSLKTKTGDIELSGYDKALHFNEATGAITIDGSAGTDDNSRKLIVGAYSNNVTGKLVPVEPDAGIVARIDKNGSNYVDLYGEQVVCRGENARIKVPKLTATTINASTIKADAELKIGSDSVVDLLNNKADVGHTHSTITGTLSIASGGTGATTARQARINLGLGGAAVKDVTTSVTAGITDLVTSEAVYTALSHKSDNSHTHNVSDIINLGTAATKGVVTSPKIGDTNLVTSGGVYTALAGKANTSHTHSISNITTNGTDYVFMNKTEQEKLTNLSKYCYVVAARDSDNKHYADVVCSSTDADDTAKLQNLINAAPIGSIIHLIAGTYYVTAPLVLEKPVTIEGSGGATQLINTTGGYIFSIKHNYVRIKDMQLKRNSTALKVSSSYPLIEFYSIKSQIISDVEISSCLFDLNDMTACIGVDGKASGVITVDNPNSLTDMTQIRIKDNTFWGSTYTGRHIDFTRIKGNMSIVVGGNIGATKINITVQNKGQAVYNYGQDSNITYTTTNTASVVNSYDSASDDSNDEVKEVE
jgi:hypothetical protein